MRKVVFIVFLYSFCYVEAQVCFDPANSYIMGTNVVPQRIVSGDFNGDGKIDIVEGNSAVSDLRISLGDGLGNFNSPTIIDVNLIFPISTNDFNNDNVLDLAVVNASNGISIYLGIGNGTFAAPTNFVVNSSTGIRSITCGHFNADTNIDLAVTNSGGFPVNVDYVSILLGTGSGGFGNAVNFSTGVLPISSFSSDFNADGNNDLAVANGSSSTVSIFIGNGAGSFSNTVNYSIAGSPRNISGSDFNEDGIIDLCVSNGSSNSVAILIGSGVGTFSNPVNYAAGNSTNRAICEDFDGDGYIDIATSNSISNNVALLTGNGSGVFSAPISFSVGNNPFEITCADFNGDAKPDLATANGTTNNISVLLNCSAIGIHNLIEEEEILVFPNPSSGKFTIKFDAKGKMSSIQVYNPIGEQIFSSETSANQTNIELINQPTGVYFLHLKTENKLIVKKIVVQ